MSGPGSDPYDPQAPEDDKPGRSAYLSRKEVRTIGIMLLVALTLLLPVYNVLKRRSEKALCSRNLNQISTALNLYLAEHDERFPPLYSTLPGTNKPGPVEGSQWVGTWGGDILSGMGNRATLTCPSAQPEEIVHVADPRQGRKPLPMTYGMYAPYGAYPRSSVDNPDQVVLIAETSNRGARDTFDPLPFPGGDAFVIGWDNDNFRPNAATKSVTRLAFPETKGGTFREGGLARHDEGIHALSATGSLMRLKPNQAQVQIERSLGLPGGMWAAPVRSRRNQQP